MESGPERPLNRFEGERLVWMFHSVDSASVFPTGVWSSRERAEVWISEMGATGILSAYIVDESAYESNVRLGLLKLSKPERSEIPFKKAYTTAVDHEHYEHGRRA